MIDNINTSVDTATRNEALCTRIAATLFILVVSLFAVSFPSLSKRVSFLSIPRIIFFIGKHFGTGVILSTAFVHLLQDAFEVLSDPVVVAHWKVNQYTGLIVLCSLLSIFLVEYISTSYVDRLQSYSSPSPSLGSTPGDESPAPLCRGRSASPKSVGTTGLDSERTPLIATPHHHHHAQTFAYGSAAHYGHAHGHANGTASAFFEGHHRHESRDMHSSHHDRGPRLPKMYGPEEFGQAPPSGVGHILDREGGHPHTHGLEDDEPVTHIHEHHHHHEGGDEEVIVGKKRQIVGILVLQLGIMIHSLVIGLTLSITSGPEFTSLLIAVIFHQLFEGLSLGIRIASLPSSEEHEFKYLNILKPVLASLFAITTPAGIVLGIVIFGQSKDIVHMRLAQGIMSAISAGMLIYAACVEMLAGDFVMDPILWRSGLGKQALALLSLAAGVTAMALVGT
ncbi:Zinc/iron permease [Paxillus ammoniavirescens]|nr:Zinc/iron permease [Paxillus ammoniavirescens]